MVELVLNDEEKAKLIEALSDDGKIVKPFFTDEQDGFTDGFKIHSFTMSKMPNRRQFIKESRRVKRRYQITGSDARDKLAKRYGFADFDTMEQEVFTDAS